MLELKEIILIALHSLNKLNIEINSLSEYIKLQINPDKQRKSSIL